MPVAYDPLNFWGVLFSPGGMVRMIPRASLLLPFAIGAASLEEWGPEGTKILYSSLDSMTIPFTMLVGLLTSFRVTDAFNKWKGAAKSVDMLHAFSKEVITRLCAFCEPTAENLASVVEIRRLMVLGVVLLQKHVRGLDDFELELKSGLITTEELQQLTKDKLSICVNSGKKDRFPSKNRPAFAYMKCHQATMASGLVDAVGPRLHCMPTTGGARACGLRGHHAAQPSGFPRSSLRHAIPAWSAPTNCPAGDGAPQGLPRAPLPHEHRCRDAQDERGLRRR